MKQFWRRIWKNFKRPNAWQLGILYCLTFVLCAFAVGLLIDEKSGAVAQTFADVVYAVAGLTLAYTVYTIIVYLPIVKNRLSQRMKRSAFGRHLLASYGFRTVVFSAYSLLVNLANVVFHIVIASMENSLWYASLAGYYGMLVALRSGIIAYHGNKRKKTRAQRALIERRQYRTCAVLLIILPIFLTAPILGVVFMGRAFIYERWMGIAFAAYAFYKIIMAVWHLIKTRDVKDLTVKALRNVGFADALVSMFSLQTALLFAFSSGKNYALVNGITGGAVCLCTILLGVIMLVNAHNKAKGGRREWKQDL
jgi:hypothetical protein